MNTAFGHLELLNTTVTAWHWLLGSDSTMAVHPTSLPSGDPATFRMKPDYSYGSLASPRARVAADTVGVPFSFPQFGNAKRALEHLAVTVATSLRCKSPECCLISTVLHLPALNLLGDFSGGIGGGTPTSQGGGKTTSGTMHSLCSIVNLVGLARPRHCSLFTCSHTLESFGQRVAPRPLTRPGRASASGGILPPGLRQYNEVVWHLYRRGPRVEAQAAGVARSRRPPPVGSGEVGKTPRKVLLHQVMARYDTTV